MGGPPPAAAGGSTNGTLILVLGILSICCCGILGPVAWVMGNQALAQLDQGYGDQSQRGTVTTGRILGIIGTVLWILLLILRILGFGAMMMGGRRPF